MSSQARTLDTLALKTLCSLVASENQKLVYLCRHVAIACSVHVLGGPSHELPGVGGILTRRRSVSKLTLALQKHFYLN